MKCNHCAALCSLSLLFSYGTFLLFPATVSAQSAASRTMNQGKKKPKVKIEKLEATEDPKIWLAEGQFSVLSEGDALWAFVRDRFGNYYLQSPSADLTEDEASADSDEETVTGSWLQENLRRADDNITILVIVAVNARGDRLLEEWVDHERWGAISRKEVGKIPGYGEVARMRFPESN